METPFVFGKIATDQNFTDRRVETERLLQNFRSLTNTIIISPRRWGKSSLVTHAAKQLLASEGDVKLCMIDLFNVIRRGVLYIIGERGFNICIFQVGRNSDECQKLPCPLDPPDFFYG